MSGKLRLEPKCSIQLTNQFWLCSWVSDLSHRKTMSGYLAGFAYWLLSCFKWSGRIQSEPFQFSFTDLAEQDLNAYNSFVYVCLLRTYIYKLSRRKADKPVNGFIYIYTLSVLTALYSQSWGNRSHCCLLDKTVKSACLWAFILTFCCLLQLSWNSKRSSTVIRWQSYELHWAQMSLKLTKLEHKLDMASTDTSLLQVSLIISLHSYAEGIHTVCGMNTRKIS